jgi:hypothetical protein
MAIGHVYKNGECLGCGLTRSGNKITFGSYPQSKVTDSSLVSALNAKAGAWTEDNGVYYVDVESGNEKYRGVKSENGAASWFKYEPISWTILEQSDGKALILCDMIIDAHRYDDDKNNYVDSEIRAWLNGNFIDTAFGELQKEVILVTEVDNSSKTVADYSGNHPYLCENTNDKVFLLAKSDIKNADYGFNGEADRKKTATAYAIANGAYVDSNGGAWWWLRTPTYDYTRPDKSDLAHNIKVSGAIHSSNVYLTTGGVVPAMWIAL